MPRFFTRSSSEYLEASSAAETGMPLFIGAKIRLASLPDELVVFGVYNSASRHQFEVVVRDTGAFRCRMQYGNSGGSSRTAATSSTITADGQWHTIVGCFTATNRRWITMDGANKNINTASGSAPSGINRTRAGVGWGGGPALKDHFDGDICSAVIGDFEPTDAACRAFHAGAHPLEIWPQSGIKGYWELRGDNSPEPESLHSGSALDLTLNGTPSKGAGHSNTRPYTLQRGIFVPEEAVAPSDVFSRGLSPIEQGVIASQGGGHSGLHPIDEGFVS